MSRKPTKAGRRLSVKGLTLKRHPRGWVDQYGRVLQQYVNDKGQVDMKPIGIDTESLRPRKGGAE